MGWGVCAGKWLPWVVRDVGAKFGAGVTGVDLSRNELASCQSGWMGPRACCGTPWRLKRLEIMGNVCHGVSGVDMSWEPWWHEVWMQ